MSLKSKQLWLEKVYLGTTMWYGRHKGWVIMQAGVEVWSLRRSWCDLLLDVLVWTTALIMSRADLRRSMSLMSQTFLQPYLSKSSITSKQAVNQQVYTDWWRILVPLMSLKTYILHFPAQKRQRLQRHAQCVSRCHVLNLSISILQILCSIDNNEQQSHSCTAEEGLWDYSLDQSDWFLTFLEHPFVLCLV